MTSVNMQSAGDTDWFKVEMTAGKTYTFDIAGLDDEADYEVAPPGQAADSAVQVPSPDPTVSAGTVTITADATGAYALSVNDPSGMTGAYTVTAAVATNSYTLAKDVTLAIGATDKATMQTAGDTDWFKVNLTAGDTYTFKTTGLDASAMYGIVPAGVAADGAVAPDGFIGPAKAGAFTFTADASGAYEISVVDYSGLTGAYTISAAAAADTYTLAKDVTLTAGDTDKARMQAAADTDWFKINLKAGATYSFTETGLTSRTELYIVPADKAADQEIPDFAAKSTTATTEQLTFTADATGAYELSVFDPSGMIGAYTISAAVATNTYTLADGVTLAVGATDKASIQAPGDTDWFKIDLTAGKTYVFKTTGLNAFAAMDVIPAAEAAEVDFPVAIVSDQSPAQNQEITYTAASTGAYEFLVSDFNGYTGAYTVSDAVVANTFTLNADVTLAVGATDKVTMQAAGDTDWFKVDLTKGKTYTFKTTGLDDEVLLDVASALQAVNTSVQPVGPTDPATPGEVTFTADTTGVYEVSVSDESGKTGAYTISAAVVADTYTLAAGVTLTAAAPAAFSHAMAALGAAGGAHQAGLAANVHGPAAAMAALAVGLRGMPPGRPDVSWA